MWKFIVEHADYIISIFTTLFAVAGMQFRNMRVILITQIIANSLLAAQCIIGGTASSGGIVFLAIAQTIVSYVFTAKKRRFPIPLTLGFMAGFTAITIIYFSTPFDLLTMVAAWFFAIAIVQTKTHICRICSLTNTILWLIYDIFVMPSGLINHSIIGILILVSILRLDLKDWKETFTRVKSKRSDTETTSDEKTTNDEQSANL